LDLREAQGCTLGLFLQAMLLGLAVQLKEQLSHFNHTPQAEVAAQDPPRDQTGYRVSAALHLQAGSVCRLIECQLRREEPSDPEK